MNTHATAQGPYEYDHHQSEQHIRMNKHSMPRMYHSPRALKRINAFIVLLILLMTMFMILGMACNKSPSSPRGLYRLSIGNPQRGNYVALAMPLKRIAGVGGDIVTVTPQGSYINGRLISNSAPLLTPHCPYGQYILARTQLWVIGQDPMSWDSRYYCAVPITLVNSIAQPILTW